MNRDAVEEIKRRIPIEELIGSYIKLEKSGKAMKAKCPFHNEKTASFFVSPDRGGYYCFGCNAKGDIFTFVEKFEGLDFKGALKVLAEKAGVSLAIDHKVDNERDRLFRITEDAAAYFETQHAASKEAQAYIKSRGISPETRQSFRIGWAPEGWQNVINHLRSKKWPDATIEMAGLAKKTDEGKFYDRFRGRVIFPITDSSGRVVGFTGRILPRLDDGKSAKYLNTPETPLFNKSQILFGLDKAKSEIRRIGYSILVEGQMDLVLSHQVGVKNTVAASGTALTDQARGDAGTVSNLELVRRLSPNMIIALDSDKAGKTAAMRAVAATALSLGMSVKIADIEGGKDPADLILVDPENWKTVLRGAKHVIEFELANVVRDVPDPHKLGRAVKERVFPFLARIDSEMDKAYYVKMIAEKLQLSEHAVWDDLRNQRPEIRGQRSEVRSERSEARDQKSDLSSPVSGLSDSTHRLDLVERRMFGLLGLMESAKLPQAAEYRLQAERIAGPSYPERLKRIEPLLHDLLFEAEALYGSDPSRFDLHMKELLSNFEEDMINEQLMAAMGELRRAEKAGETARTAELAKKCQELSVRKAELAKKK